MTFTEFLNFEIIRTKTFTVTTYNVLEILVILLLTYLLVFLVKKLFDRRVKRKTMDIGSAHTIYNIIRYILWVVALVMILENLEVKITLLVAGSAALLVGIGLGLQQLFKDMISGIFLLFDRSITVGDVVELENVVGKVKHIGLRTSTIISRDNITIIIPNSRFMDDKVINWSATDNLTRFHVSVGVAYGSDVRLVEKVLLGCAGKHPDIDGNNKPFVRFNDFADSALEFRLYFWTMKSFEAEIIKSDLRFAIEEAFRKNKIVIPFPQRDVHMYQGGKQG